VTNQSLAGYRIVRTIAETARAVTVLAQPALPTESRAELVVLKCYLDGVPSSSILAECEAMTSISSPHLPAVYDLASVSGNRLVAVCEWIPGTSLSKLLKSRSHFTAGEAITILVPLVETLARLHRAGIVHGGVSVDSVLFRESGSPVLIGLSQAARFVPQSTPAELSHNSTVRSDIDSLTHLCVIVLSVVRSDSAGQQKLEDGIAWMTSTPLSSDPQWATALEERLFALGAPEPVRVVGADLSASQDDPQPRRVSTLLGGAATEAVGAPSDRISVFGIPSWLQNELVRGLVALRLRLSHLRTWVHRWVAPVRPRMWLLGGIAVAALVTALLVAGVAPPDAVEPPESLSSTSHSAGVPTASPVNANPQLALGELLFTRERCFRDLSEGCLRDVSQVDSPAFTADSGLIAHIISGGELNNKVLLRFDEVLVTQELGDSVIFSLTSSANDKPATVLLVKGEAGWRMRSYTLPD
jgi:serine/threonine protein kinase